MRDCIQCRAVETELEKVALEYLRLTSSGKQDNQVNDVAKQKMLEVQKRFNEHKLAHEKMRDSETK